MTISHASLASSGIDPLRAIFGQHATGAGIVTRPAIPLVPAAQPGRYHH